MYSSRAAHGSLKTFLPSPSNRGAMVSRSQSSASRSGPRHSWFHPRLPPELHPQLLRQRSTPWTQLQELFSMIRTSWVGGNFSRCSP